MFKRRKKLKIEVNKKSKTNNFGVISPNVPIKKQKAILKMVVTTESKLSRKSTNYEQLACYKKNITELVFLVSLGKWMKVSKEM